MFNTHHWFKVSKAREELGLEEINLVAISEHKPHCGPVFIHRGQTMYVQKVYLEWWGEWLVKIIYHNQMNSHGIKVLKKFSMPTTKIGLAVEEAQKIYRSFINEQEN